MTREYRNEQVLALLTALEENKPISQQSLSRQLGIAVGLVNALIKRTVQKGFVKVREVPARRFAYYLTAKGFAEKSRLVAEYLQSSLAFFQEARLTYSKIFSKITENGRSRVIFAGSGELAELAQLVSSDYEIDVVAILDLSRSSNSSEKIPLVSKITSLPDFDAIVITDLAAPQNYFEKLRPEVPLEKLFVPSFLKVRVSTDQNKVGKKAGGA